jgi:hypothetical protein
MSLTTCAACGHEGEGAFCTRCGHTLAAGRACANCGTGVAPGALYCGECGAPVDRRPAKPLRARLPWILSGLALVAFAVAISLMIGKSVGLRAPGEPPTGSIISGSSGESGTPGAPAGDALLDPASVDLSQMEPREAADRLFDRALRTEAEGDTTGALFFADMGVRAYEALPGPELDLDARFHIGLLQAMRGDTAAAGRTADAMLAEAPDHLLALVLRARLAERAGDEAARVEAHRHFLAALEAERAKERPEYAQHANVIDAEAGGR